MVAWHRTNEPSRNLATIPGIGPITATVLAATVPGPSIFKNGRLACARSVPPARGSPPGRGYSFKLRPRLVTQRTGAVTRQDRLA